jgi:hypothetical protein
MIRDAWLLAVLVGLHLLFAPLMVLAIAHHGLSTFSSEMFQLSCTYLSPGTFFLVAPAKFVLLSSGLLRRPERPVISRTSLVLYSALLVVALVHEFRLWVSCPFDEIWIGRLAISMGSPGLLAIGVVAYRNVTAPTRTNAFVFNGLLVWWLFTTAFPFFPHLWDF